MRRHELTFFALRFLLLLLFFALAHTAIAANINQAVNHAELRYQVNVPSQDMSQALLLAAPMLANRLVAGDSRAEADKLQLTQAMLHGYAPYTDNNGVNGLRLRFDPSAINAVLQKLGVHVLIKQARMQIKIVLPAVINNDKKNAQEAAQNLLLYAKELATQLGVRMDNDAPLWSIHWEWMNQANRVLKLTARGYSDNFHEIRQIPIVSVSLATTLRPWLESVLLRIRDAESLRQTLAIDNHTIVDNNADVANSTDTGSNILTIKSNNLTLTALVKMEKELQDDPRIQQLSLYSIGTNQQQYNIRIYGNNSQWLHDWFARRGLRMQASDGGGWVVR